MTRNLHCVVALFLIALLVNTTVFAQGQPHNNNQNNINNNNNGGDEEFGGDDDLQHDTTRFGLDGGPHGHSDDGSDDGSGRPGGEPLPPFWYLDDYFFHREDDGAEQGLPPQSPLAYPPPPRDDGGRNGGIPMELDHLPEHVRKALLDAVRKNDDKFMGNGNGQARGPPSVSDINVECPNSKCTRQSGIVISVTGSNLPPTTSLSLHSQRTNEEVLCRTVMQSDTYIISKAVEGSLSNVVASQLDVRLLVGPQILTIHRAITLAEDEEPKIEQIEAEMADYEEIGIGGLGWELDELKRKVLRTRHGPLTEVLGKLKVRPTRGVVLYGPPGTGKTLIARKLAKLLNARSTRIVNGPELMSKYVGDSEANIRQLFSVAEKDFKFNKEKAGLHVVILDEMDAMLRPRGSGDESGARVAYDSVTTQLLALMDGYDSVPNVLLIGLTNRIAALDPALLRPGRFEIRIRLPVPTEQSRYEILRIHTRKLREQNLMSDAVDLKEFAKRMVGLTGADIEGVIRGAVSYAMERGEEGSVVVNEADLSNGLRDILSDRNRKDDILTHMERGIIDYGSELTRIRQTFDRQLRRLKKSASTRSMRVLLEGPRGCGLSALAAYLATSAEMPAVRFVSAASLIGKTPDEKLRVITAAFDDVRDADSGIVVLDEVEALIEYHPLGTRFNGVMLHEITVLLSAVNARSTGSNSANSARSKHTKAGKVMVLMTSHDRSALEVLNMASTWDVAITVPALRQNEIKQVLEGLQLFASVEERDMAVALLVAGTQRSSMPVKRIVALAEAALALGGTAATGAPEHIHDLAAKYVAHNFQAARGGVVDVTTSSASRVSLETWKLAIKLYGNGAKKGPADNEI
eukprot:PhM_4_TR18773/c0_g1_i1/m.58862/K06027/NSF, SEC18; vesicle-fusing ATPase